MTTERKPTPKKNYSLTDFKEKLGIKEPPDKPLEWIPVADSLEKATGVPGFPKGYVSLAIGWSDTGKSQAVLQACVSAQKMGIVPIIIDTENNISKGSLYMTSLGFDWEGDYILVNNDDLLRNYGKKRDKKTESASIEDMASFINDVLDQQKAGKLPYELLFAIDSIGSLDCNQTIKSLENDTGKNNMWNAGAYERVFKPILNFRIPSSRREGSPYTNTVIAVNKVWLDDNKQMNLKGGTCFDHVARLQYIFGGILTKGTKKVTADSKLRTVVFGMETKVEAKKNQFTYTSDKKGVSGAKLLGRVILTPFGMISTSDEDINEFKKKNLLFFRNALGGELEAKDINFKFEEVVDEKNAAWTPEDINKVLKKSKADKEEAVKEDESEA